MDDQGSEPDFAAHAGLVAFPRDIAELTDTTLCPACFTPLSGTICAACGLDLSHPAAFQLLRYSQDAARLLQARVSTIGRMRFDQAKTPARTEVPAAVEVPVRPTHWQPVFPTATGGQNPNAPSAEQPPARPTKRPTASATPPGPRRSSVQVLLLLVGVSLLSIAAIFFLVYALITYGLVTRSIIIGAITVAAFVVAGLLRRRGLTATAEGIGTFSVVLIYLDAFAVRANDLLGLTSVPAQTYWGVTLVVSGVAFIVWHRRTGPRSASIAGFATFAPGVGLVVAGAARGLDDTTGVFLSFAAVAAAGVIHRATRAGGFAERIIILSTTSLALLFGFLAALMLDHDWDWAPAFGLALLAVIGLAHAGVLATDRPDSAADTVVEGRAVRLYGAAFAGFGGAASALAMVAVAIRVGDPSFGSFAPPVIGALLALLLEFGSRTLRSLRMRAHALVGARAAGVVAIIALLLPAYLAVQNTVAVLTTSLSRPWTLTPMDVVDPSVAGAGWAVAALAVVGGLAGAIWRAAKLSGRLRLVRWFEVGTILVAVPLLGVLWLVLVGYLLLAALTLTLALRRASAEGYRGLLLGLLSGALALGYLIGWSSQSTWLAGSLGLIAALLISRRVCRTSFDAASVLGVAVIAALIAAAAAAHQLAPDAVAGASAVNVARFVGILATVFLLGSLLLRSLLPRSAVAGWPTVRGRAGVSVPDRRSVFWLSAAAAGACAVIGHQELGDLAASERATLLLPEFGTSLAVNAALVVVLALWVLVPSPELPAPGPSSPGPSSPATPDERGALRIERIAAGLLVTPALYLVVDALALTLQLDSSARSATPVAAALLASGGALAITLRRPSVSPRWAREVGIALVGVPAVAVTFVEPNPASWLVLVLGGLTALILAIDTDGLLSSVSPRKHLGWVALALATAGFWRRLAGDNVHNLEAYVLPLAGVLLVIAVLSVVSARRRGAGDPIAAPLLVLGGLLIAVLPLSVDAASGAPMPALVIGAACAVLLLVGGFLPRPARTYLDAATLAGAIGVLVVATGRASFLLISGTAGPLPDAWLGGGFLLLLITAFGIARLPVDRWRRQRMLASEVLGVVAMGAVLVVVLGLVLGLALDGAPVGRLGPVRIIALAFAFSAVHVLALTLRTPPFTPRVGTAAIVFAGVAVLAGSRILEPIEWGTVPIAFALLSTGFAHLNDTPTARSWRWIGPGFAVLLIPSLVAAIGERPLWRLVAIGVVGVAVIVLGAVRRLQAPLLIGIAVVLIHGIATFAPQIRAVYELANWWVWAGIGGVLLIVLAAQYEKRIQNFKSVAMRISALR
ncbi:hypothetical protein GCM10027052_11100 [Parafrigoribacterium mesophilum]|uniref:SCO7613 C-terminal domain-containing membrane protein n=1 Tax=Parafrigoribacterium mesophilum TaxID=433646 RepID=UPI0031FC87BB